MDNLETIMQQNQEMVKDAVRMYLTKERCPHNFGLKDRDDCKYQPEQCALCWEEALKNQ
jgi:hypothetical protein